MSLLDLLGGQRAIVGTVRERERHRLLAGTHAHGITVDVKQAHVLEQLAARAGDALDEHLVGDRLVHHDGKVHVHTGQRGNVLVRQLLLGELLQGINGQLEGHDRIAHAKVLERRGMDAAHPTKRHVLGDDLGTVARLQPAVLLGVGGLELDLGDAQRGKKLLHHALGVKEVVLEVLCVPAIVVPAAAQHAGDVGGLLGKARVLAAKQYAADLVQVDVGHAMVLVVRNGAQQAGDEVATHLALIGHQRADDLDRHALALVAHAQALKVARVGKAVGARLAEAAGTHRGANGAQALLVGSKTTGVVACGGKRGLDIALAVQAHDLLDQVDLAREVRAVGGCRDIPGLGACTVHGAAQALQAHGHEVVVDGCACDQACASGTEGHLRGSHRRGVRVNHTRAHRGAAAALEERSRDVRHSGAAIGIDHALVADGCLAHEVEHAAGAADVAAIEGSALKQHVNGLVGDLAVEAAHDAGKGNCAVLAIRDDGVLVRELALLAIQGGEHLAVAGGTDHDVALSVDLRELAKVKGVQRLSGEEHDIVGDIDHVVDGTGAGSHDALCQPVGAGANLDAAHHACGIARAQVGVVDGDINEVGRRGSHLVLDLGQVKVGVLVKHGADLNGNAGHREAVGAIGSHLAVDHRVANAAPLCKVEADGSVFRKLHDARVIGA